MLDYNLPRLLTLIFDEFYLRDSKLPDNSVGLLTSCKRLNPLPQFSNAGIFVHLNNSAEQIYCFFKFFKFHVEQHSCVDNSRYLSHFHFSLFPLPDKND